MHLFFLLVIVLFSNNLQALEFDQPITAAVMIHNPPTAAGLGQHLPSKKWVTLMNIKLTPQQKQDVLHYPIDHGQIAQHLDFTRGLPRQADVGMNAVPVLDQGPHGSCVTFANTAAIDALLAKGDYISQLCNLELGRYFEKKGYVPSGWDGSFGPIVLNQILSFGIMNKDHQRAQSCGGLTEYPLSSPNSIGKLMLLDEFKQSSENLNENMYWNSLLSFYERFQWKSFTTKQADALLTKVKTALATQLPYQSTRLSFATLLPVDYCSAGACARYHAEEDTWALTKTIINDNNPYFGGHEMVITGYDDDAIAIDHDGSKHQGLLTLRNSWGSDTGDHGNYYMSYDFFKQFVMEVQEIVMTQH